MENSNKSAFPTDETGGAMGRKVQYGLTKRELFSAMAMQGLCANPSALESYYAVANLSQENRTMPRVDAPEILTKESIAIADELLKQLEA